MSSPATRLVMSAAWVAVAVLASASCAISYEPITIAARAQGTSREFIVKSSAEVACLEIETRLRGGFGVGFTWEIGKSSGRWPLRRISAGDRHAVAPGAFATYVLDSINPIMPSIDHVGSIGGLPYSAVYFVDVYEVVSGNSIVAIRCGERSVKVGETSPLRGVHGRAEVTRDVEGWGSEEDLFASTVLGRRVVKGEFAEP